MFYDNTSNTVDTLEFLIYGAVVAYAIACIIEIFKPEDGFKKWISLC